MLKETWKARKAGVGKVTDVLVMRNPLKEGDKTADLGTIWKSDEMFRNSLQDAISLDTECVWNVKQNPGRKGSELEGNGLMMSWSCAGLTQQFLI